MAKCVRCGTSFSYQKRDGVCPKCCFYNRPEGMAAEDMSWLKKYNIDEGYQFPKMGVESFEENEPDISDLLNMTQQGKKKKASHKELDGSHVHGENGRIIKPVVARQWKSLADMTPHSSKPIEPGSLSKKTKANAALIGVIVYVIMMFIAFIVSL